MTVTDPVAERCAELQGSFDWHAGVANAVVVPRPGEKCVALVKACVMPAPGSDATSAVVEKLQHLQEKARAGVSRQPV